MKEALKKYLIPHEGNDHSPHILRPRTIAFVCMVALVAEAVFVFGTTYITPNSKLFGIITVNALVDETNQSRITDALPALRTDPLLTAAAQAKANDMATKGYFAHTSPTGVTPWYWFEQAGYSFTYAGENLAVNFSDSQDVTNAWMHSSEHRENILNNNFTEIGIATAEGVYKGEPATFVVELFGTPSFAPLTFVNTAAAAAAGSVPVSNPAPKPVTKPIAKSLTVPVLPGVPSIVLTNTTATAVTSDPAFVAVKGAETQTVPATVVATGTAPAPQAVANPAPQSNMLQRAFSDPKGLANDFYLFLMGLFAVAVILNIFIKIRIQHPKLIFSGLLVIIVAGLCIILNQNISLLHAAVM